MNAPKVITWFIALILGGLAIASVFVAIPFVSAYAFWFLTAGFVLLLIGCLIKGL